jgi:hypothetical protein
MRNLILFVLSFFIFTQSYSQCNGPQSFTMTPVAPAGGYLPGTTVTVCYTMSNYIQTGSNWVEGFDLNLGSGWTSLTPITPPSNCGGAGSGGQWIWLNTSTSTALPITTVGPGYFFDLNSNGVAGDDFGDNNVGGCSWSFCFTVTVVNICTPQNLLIQITAGSDGVWGSYTSTSCDVTTPFTVYSGTSNPSLPTVGPINHN